MIQAKLYGAIALALLIAGLAFGFKLEHGWRVKAENALVEYQAAAAGVITERLRAQEETKAENERKTKETISAYTNRITALRGNYAVALERMRNVPAAPPAGGGGAVSPTAPAPGGVDAAPVVDPTSRFLRDLQGCDEDRETLRALQDWIKRTH